MSSSLDDNPFSPPLADSFGPRTKPAAPLRRDLLGVHAAFPIGRDDHVSLYWSHWTGLEVYWLNEVEVLRLHNFRQFARIERVFVVDEGRREIRFSGNLLTMRFSARVNGEPAGDDLFPQERRQRTVANWIGIGLGSCVLLCWLGTFVLMTIKDIAGR